MKVPTILSVGTAAVLLTSAGLAANYDDLAAKGYRWITVDGPYACASKDDLPQITDAMDAVPPYKMALRSDRM